MAGCNCKSDKNIDSYIADANEIKKPIGSTIGMYVLKTLAFLLMIVALPIINLFIIWFIFRTLILNKTVDIKPLLYAIGKKFKEDEDDDEDDYDDLTEDDVVMVDVEDITKKSK